MSRAPAAATHALAERHEALWLRLAALHKDIAGLATKRPAAAPSDAIRITAESLLSDCAPFLPRGNGRLPVAAADLAGLAVQLGQALAGLEAWEAANSSWRADLNAFVWSLPGAGAPVPVKRLRPRLAAAAAKPEVKRRPGERNVRELLAERILALKRAARVD